MTVHVEQGRDTRQRMLDFITAHQDVHGWAPTVREIADAVGLRSPSPAYKHLRILQREGKLVLGGGPRMIRVTNGHIDLR